MTGARYEAADSKKPGYLAAYDIADTSLFQDPKYTKLRANRSPREGDLVKRLESLDRRMAERLEQTSEPPVADKTAKHVLTVESDTKPADLRIMSKVPGWQRSHVHHVFDALIVGAGKEPVTQAPAYLTVHGRFSASCEARWYRSLVRAEFDNDAYQSSQELKEAVKAAKTVRKWTLYRAWPNTAS